ncbi:MAG: hypothetical protein A3D92_14025 [Bacteroidetes bacterium RIFCSPHIGHO2_02_FULL_44_7]|nr:MAG: hypothetical protein A3D92_14025 [Bacteroidetes bacterium RIFCSPHIGHO2_02_FULL_44_7]
MVKTNNVELSITSPWQDETFEYNYTLSIDGILRSEEFIDGYEVILVNESTLDPLDYYREEGSFNYFAVHHHWTNHLSTSAHVHITINALDQEEILASTELSVYCKK